jgi:antitoxin ParD1/3/4
MDMTTLNISLPENLKAFAEEQADIGGYTSVSEYLRELLRADQRQKAALKLDAIILEGINSGPATPMTKTNWEAIHRSGLAKLAAKKKRKKGVE